MNFKYFIVIAFILSSITSYSQKKNYKTEKFTVAGNCGQCKDRIENTLKKLGVYTANWNEETQMLTVSFDSIKLSKANIQKILSAAGHDSKGFTAPANAYNKLPGCCKYERLNDTDSTKKNIVDTTASIKKVDTAVMEKHNETVVKIDTTPIRKITNDTLTKNEQLSEIKIESRKFSTYIANTVATNTLTMTTKELNKAACCNLSESFETSPSIDVSYSDAVTGIKQIQLLGLSGNYTQITTENVPEIRGLAGAYGLTFIPGPFVESVQVTKGTGSVANGFESIAGQINIEEKKSEGSEKILVNAYANHLGRMESSVNLSTPVSNKLHTALLLHANGVNNKIDNNKDGFLDIPVGNQVNVINRWLYENGKGLESQFIVKILNDKRTAGETTFNETNDKLTANKYGVGMNVQQNIFTGKLGYVFPKKKYQSIGLMLSLNNYTNNAYYGLNAYNAEQHSFYANLIYQSIIGTTTHKYRTGLSLMNDNYNETFATANFKRKEIVAGAFAEYTFTPNEKLTAIAGLRVDKHNEYGFITTPRLNIKYAFNKNTSLRFSAGSGFRTANIFAENTGLFISSREYNVLNPSSNYGYGLQPEKAWNFGFNILHKFKINDQNGTVSIDAYKTIFDNQTVVDVDNNPQKILFYNLSGKSFSNSIQAEINYELIKKFDVRLAYRFLDVQTNYSGSMLSKPLTAKHRAFINLAYQTKNNWLFDVTTQWIGEKRLPSTHSNPADKRMMHYSPSYIQLAAQVTKQFGKKWDVYIGAENLTNAMQDVLMIDAQQPFSKYFDASIVWGNVNGSIFYAGMRFKLK